MKILILGINGMLGSTLFFHLSQNKKNDIFGTTRNKVLLRSFKNKNNIFCGVDATEFSTFRSIIEKSKPDLIINCIGVIKQKLNDINLTNMTLINTDFPKYLNDICKNFNMRMIHISTDCVFSGNTGMYNELSVPDPIDEYGLSKLKGEVVDSKNTLTLRMSIVGHEMTTNYSLLDWFLSQKSSVTGYSKAIFSGLTTLELSSIIEKYVINSDMSGLYHIGNSPIDKMLFLKIVAKHYKKSIQILDSSQFKINRSLDSSFFTNQTGYIKPTWDKMVMDLYSQDYLKYRINKLE